MWVCCDGSYVVYGRKPEAEWEYVDVLFLLVDNLKNAKRIWGQVYQVYRVSILIYFYALVFDLCRSIYLNLQHGADSHMR